ncbi:hypothetical protein ACN4EK_11900 [Pantanalinema rosaneae CENA516]|uniref:C1 family peptidase n=1 Tax=Pantanalinema rosaneae TaxID=1620701 RepID=UPI003D6E7100
MEPEIKVGCSRSDSDIRDYTFIDALNKLSKQQGIELKFGIWHFPDTDDIKPDGDKTKDKPKDRKYYEYKESGGWVEVNSPSDIQKKDLFLKYCVHVASPSECNDPCCQTTDHEQGSPVLIPLNFRGLEQQKTLSLEIYQGTEQSTTDEQSQGKSKSVELDLNLQPGQLVIKDAQNKIIGYVGVHKDKVYIKSINNKTGNKIIGNIAVSHNGKITIQKHEPTLDLYLGVGFRSYTIDPVNWSPIEDQSPGILCGANAGVALLEYFERLSSGKHFDASRLFLHQAACHIMQVPLTSPVSVRAIVTALSTIGVPPEEYWPYDLNKLTEEPPAWCYAYARNYRAESYIKLDRLDLSYHALIAQIKIFIYSGLPVIFGFSVHQSVQQSFNKQPFEGLLDDRILAIFKALEQTGGSNAKVKMETIISFLEAAKSVVNGKHSEQHFNEEGQIPFPTFGEIYQGAHAVVAVGYDDDKLITNSSPLGKKDREQIRRAYLKNDDTWTEYEWDINANGYRQKGSNSIPFQDFRFLDFSKFDGKFIQLTIKPNDKEKLSDNPVLVPESLQFSKDLTARAERLESVISADEHLVTKGAFKIRNSWGQDWGDNGHGWLPYAYVYSDLTFDWWSILKFEWINTDDFGLLRDNGDLVMCDPDTCPNGENH